MIWKQRSRWLICVSMMAVGSCLNESQTDLETDTNATEMGSTLLTDNESTSSTSTNVDTSTSTTSMVTTEVPPTSASELLPWLEAGSYTGWAAEENYHASLGPHGDFVRAWFNDTLAASLTSSSEATHPQNSASVKELMSAGGNLIGWAVTVKVQADSDGGRGWYWYEIIGDNVIADGQGVGFCTGCHTGGQDFIQSAFP